MKWQDLRRSDNVEDRRGFRVPGGAVGGGIGTLVVVVVALLLGVDPRGLLQNGAPSSGTSTAATSTPGEDSSRDFVAAILGSTEETWTAILSGSGQTYRPPTLVLFTGATQSACGMGQSAMGPFYCPRDEKVYIDLAF